jgi:hypothetical protein
MQSSRGATKKILDSASVSFELKRALRSGFGVSEQQLKTAQVCHQRVRAAKQFLRCHHAFNLSSEGGKLHGPDFIGLIRTKKEHIARPARCLSSGNPKEA